VNFISIAAAFYIAGGLYAAENRAAPSARLLLTSPLDFQVAQRSAMSNGTVTVIGTVRPANSAVPPDKLQVQITGKSPFGSLPDQWQLLSFDSASGAFRGEFTLPAGAWYRVEVRASREQTEMALAVVEHVGVGEVFVIAGQSNSANYGEERQKTKSGLVAAFDGTTWRLAIDPQPGAGGSKGSFMPPFGDEVAKHFHVPVGIAATGIGSTSIREWLPRGTHLTRLPPLTRNVVTNAAGEWEASGMIFENFSARLKQLGTNGFRAVLWHQGESDANQADPTRTLSGQLYRLYLEQLVHESRRVAGWDVPWFVAQASYHNPRDTASPDIRAAQKSAWEDRLALQGPDTDALTGSMREKNGAGVHMSAEGLRTHAHLWFEKVCPWLQRQLGQRGS